MPLNNPVAGAVVDTIETSVYNAAAPTSWTDLDLSAKVGGKQALVLLKIFDTGGGTKLAFRTNGDTDEHYTAGAPPAGASQGTDKIAATANIYGVMAISTDAAGI